MTPTSPPVLQAPCGDGLTPVSLTRTSRVGPYGTLRTTGSDAVALTFDDGPDPVNTLAMLEVLRACHVKATFCVNGAKVAAHPDVVRRIAAEGHTLCNHTWNHDTQLGTYGWAAIYNDLKRTNDAIHAVDPRIDVAYFRAPGGMWTGDYVAVARELGMESLDWDVDPWDWNFPVNGRGEQMTVHIVNHIQERVRPGSVILAHDNLKPDTVEAMRRLLPWLTARYELIAMPAEPLLPPRDVPML
jgi:peptidoglycan/xylan/chitin deacetylase (PgdA/CDA1 family)